MRDVRNLQAMLSEGITDPALLYRQLDDSPLVIPNDGAEHPCSCGQQTYVIAEHWTWGPHPVDLEGRWVGYCHSCTRQLEAGR